MPELAEDERFVNNSQRTANRDELIDIINGCFSAYGREELRARLAAAGIAYGAVNSVDELLHHPALRQREVHSTAGAAMTIPASPVVWADHQRDMLQRPPAIGENSDSIREEFGSDND
jgi:crotonobetainyl-CoA:carnitine CoA-transferase CaiB-like acyl-CoA transferase